MNWYVQEVLMRQQIAEAQQRAARNHLVRQARSRRASADAWGRLWRRLQPSAQPAPALDVQMKGVESDG